MIEVSAVATVYEVDADLEPTDAVVFVAATTELQSVIFEIEGKKYMLMLQETVRQGGRAALQARAYK